MASYFTTRVLFLRSLATVYLVAFVISLQQSPSLIGDDGLLPACAFLGRFSGTPRLQAFLQVPTLLHFGCSTAVLQGLAAVGAALSVVVLVLGRANAPIMLTLWALQHSIIGVGQNFWSFGWESQLLETGFLGVFVVPAWSLTRSGSAASPVSIVPVMAFRFLIFRIMLGAGLIKVRGDACWLDNISTAPCMAFHYETQPVPNPASWYFHMLPLWVQSASTWVNHVVELPAPFLLWMGRKFRILGGVVQVLFQVVLISSGNLSFLNHLTILPSLWAFDDAALAVCSRRRAPVQPKLAAVEDKEEDVPDAVPHVDGLRRRKPPKPTPGGDGNGGEVAADITPPPSLKVEAPRGSASSVFSVRFFVSTALGVLIAYLSTPVVMNLLSRRQAMNTSFEPFRLVNTYGAFGSVGKTRPEIVVLGTNSSTIGADTVWYPYEFPCKPTAIDRRPCLLSPFHYRMDWLMWFAAMASYQQYPWLVHLTGKLLAGDASAHAFFVDNPFPDPATPPTFIKFDLVDMKFTPTSLAAAAGTTVTGADVPVSWGWAGTDVVEVGRWWTRRPLREYLPPLSLENPSLQQFLDGYGWKLQ